MPFSPSEPLRCGAQHFEHDAAHTGFCTAQFACVIIVQGLAELVYEGQRYPLHAGDVFKRFPLRPHDVQYRAGCSSMFVAVPAGCLASLRDIALPAIDEPRITPGCDASLRQRFTRAQRLIHRNPLDPVAALPTMLELIIEMHRSHRRRGHPYAAAIERAQAILAKHPHSDIPSIAEAVGLPASTFRRAFKQLVGTSAGAWRTRLLIERAMDLLLDPTQSIGDVAKACGHSHLFGFSAQFKRVTGISPSAWRRQHMQAVRG